MNMNIDSQNSDLDILNNEIKELKQKIYFIENHLVSMNSKMENHISKYYINQF